MRGLVFLVLVICGSCKDQEFEVKEVEFYGESILIPKELKLTDPPNFANYKSCDEDLYLKKFEDTTIVELQLCGHGHVQRKSFKKLKFFFQEQIEVIKDKSQDYRELENSSFQNQKSFQFIHYFEDKRGFFLNHYIAYDDYYLSLRMESKSKKQIDLYKNYFEDIANNDLNNIHLIDLNFENHCLYCGHPAFW